MDYNLEAKTVSGWLIKLLVRLIKPWIYDFAWEFLDDYWIEANSMDPNDKSTRTREEMFDDAWEGFW